MAFRGEIEDADHEQQLIYQLLQGMVGIMKSNGAKNAKVDKPRKTIMPREEREMDVSTLIASLGGDGVILQQK